jgi:hypothetical protein
MERWGERATPLTTNLLELLLTFLIFKPILYWKIGESSSSRRFVVKDSWERAPPVEYSDTLFTRGLFADLGWFN